MEFQQMLPGTTICLHAKEKRKKKPAKPQSYT